MAEILKEIGTDARDYATITLWEAAWGGAAGGAGNIAKGEAYDDSAFDEVVTFDDETPDSAILSVEANERHDGTAGSGARNVRTSNGNIFSITTTIPFTIECLEIDGNQNATTTDTKAIGNIWTNTIIQRCLIHGIHCSTNGIVAGIITANNQQPTIQNNIVYDLLTRATNSDSLKGIDPQDGDCYNCTIHDLTSNSGSGVCYGIYGNEPGSNVKNVISTDTSGTTSGAVADYATGGGTEDYNAASDDSDTGANSIGADDGVTSGGLFVSNSAPYDLHLKTGADAIGAGVDLGTSPAGVEIDIDGRDRDAEGDTWDMGADQFVAVGVEYIPQVMMII